MRNTNRKGKRNDEPVNPNAAYERITESVVAALTAGTAPWRQSWKRAEMPRNIDGYRYRGINIFILRMRGFNSPYWLTFDQAHKRGGHVSKGQKGTEIVFWKRITIKDPEDPEKTITIPLMRTYRVFNVEQCEDVRLPKNAIVPAEVPTPDQAEVIAAAEAIIAGYVDPPSIAERGTAAYYTPSLDSVVLPPRATFTSPDAFYSTTFHELAHSTGHAKRLARKSVVEGASFRTYEYGREELVAEMTAAFLSGECEILPQTLADSASYCQSWIRTIKEDVKAVVVAAGSAQRAADHILGRVWEASVPTEPAAAEEAPLVAAAA